MPEIWWLIAATPTGRHLWPLGEHGEATVEDRIVAAMHLLDFPIDWIRSDGYRIHVAPGDPHPDLVKVSTVHERGELDAVASADIDAYRARVESAHREAKVRAAKKLLAELDDQALAEVLAEHQKGKP